MMYNIGFCAPCEPFIGGCQTLDPALEDEEPTMYARQAGALDNHGGTGIYPETRHTNLWHSQLSRM